MNYNEAKELKAKLQKAVDNAAEAFDQFPKSGCGLVSEEIRTTAAYTNASKTYDCAFNALRNFNSKFVKVFKKELAAERKARFN